MKIIRFEIQVEEVDEVIREIEVKPSHTFKDLSDAIMEAFDFFHEHLWHGQSSAAVFTALKTP